MPIRLIQAGVVALAAAVVAGVVAISVKLTMRKLAGKKVAILGEQQVGKTTLLLTLRDGKLPRRVSKTVDPTAGGTFSLPVGERLVEFNVPKDVPGNDNMSYSTWKEALEGSDYVWYLFRADLMALNDVDTSRRVHDHLDVIGDWHRQVKGRKPRVILIGTFADMSTKYSENASEFKKSVVAGEPVKLGLVKIKNARLAVGSLVAEKDATALIRAIRGYL